jgi:hypothetical protein
VGARLTLNLSSPTSHAIVRRALRVQTHWVAARTPAVLDQEPIQRAFEEGAIADDSRATVGADAPQATPVVESGHSRTLRNQSGAHAAPIAREDR